MYLIETFSNREQYKGFSYIFKMSKKYLQMFYKMFLLNSLNLTENDEEF